MVAGAGMYRWARDLYGRDSAAMLAGVAYTISPYMLLNTYVRGAFAELGAQALLPWIFWAFRRLMLAERPARTVPAAALALGALAVTHNITLLFVPVVLVAYLLTLGYEVGFTRSNLVAVGASLLLAMGVSAYFWLPLLTEQSFLGDTAYDIARFGWLPGNVWRWDNFMQFNPVFEYDFWGLMQLGIVQVALGLVGFALALTTARRFSFSVVRPANSSSMGSSRVATPRAELWMPLALMLIASALVGAWSLPIWERFRLLTLVQFPWRLLVIITLPLAWAVGGFTSGIPWRPVRAAVGVLLVALILWANYPRLEHVSFFDEMTLEITLDHLQLAPIKIVNRQTMPRAANKVEVAMGDFAKWVGYAMPTPVATVQPVQPGQSLELTLYYESIAPTPVGYTRFVHVMHPTAGLVTQADAIPQQGANPTWSWQAGEIIADPVILTFPPDAPLGEYQLLLGFYAPEAGNVRLALQSDDAARVQQGNQALIVSVTVAE